MVSMADGVELATDIYLPEGEPPAPTLLERTPYDKRREVLASSAMWFAARGYVVALQDVRGRFASSGEWQFLPASEGEDGAATLEWIAAQEWSDGQVATMGLSYSATNQQPLALLHPKQLAAQFQGDGGYNYHHRTMRHSGAFELGVALPYVLRMAREGQELLLDSESRASFEDASAQLESWLQTLPLDFHATPLRFAPRYESWLLEMLEHGDYDRYWQHAGWNLEEHVDGYPDLPVFLQTSWYGHHVWATSERWRQLKGRGSAPKKLMIGHWTHGYGDYEQTWCGEVDFGPEAALDLQELKLEWFDRCLRGADHDPAAEEEPPVTIFVMGGGSGRRNSSGMLEHGGTWRRESEWPLERAQPTPFFLHRAGRLRREPPAPGEGSTSFVYDPLHPVPTVGGGTQNPAEPYLPRGGAFDQRGREELATCHDTRPLAERDDVLVFESEPLDVATEVTGPITVKLWVRSTAPDTDITAKLIDVYPPTPDDPQGFAMNLTDGILRLRYRNRRDLQQLLELGQIYEITLDLQATSNLFAAGHRIRLDISSSNFPRFDLNPNTGAPLGAWSDGAPATNTVFHDASHPSQVILPIIP